MYVLYTVLYASSIHIREYFDRISEFTLPCGELDTSAGYKYSSLTTRRVISQTYSSHRLQLPTPNSNILEQEGIHILLTVAGPNPGGSSKKLVFEIGSLQAPVFGNFSHTPSRGFCFMKPYVSSIKIGQWSEPMTLGRISAFLSLGRSFFDIKK